MRRKVRGSSGVWKSLAFPCSSSHCRFYTFKGVEPMQLDYFIFCQNSNVSPTLNFIIPGCAVNFLNGSVQYLAMKFDYFIVRILKPCPNGRNIIDFRILGHEVPVPRNTFQFLFLSNLANISDVIIVQASKRNPDSSFNVLLRTHKRS